MSSLTYKTIWILIFLNFLTFTSFSQIGNPIINNYQSINGFSSNQVWGMVQDKNGEFFFATNKGISRFDGLKWSLIPLPQSSAVRSIAINSKGQIFVGASREFGYLAHNEKGQLYYASLSDSLEKKDFKAVLNTFTIGDTTYFLANHEKVFVYIDKKIHELDLLGITYFRSFEIEDQLWLIDPQFGIARVKGASLEFIDTNPVPPEVYFLVLFDADNLLAGTLNNGLFIYNRRSKKWTTFKTSDDELILNSNLYTAIWLKNQKLSMASLKNGAFIMNKQGQIETILNKGVGLLNNSTYCLFQDQCYDLWIGQEKGLSHVELSVPFSKLGEHSGLDGTIQAVDFLNGNLFCGTSNGIYTVSGSNYGNKFKQLDDKYIYNLDFSKIIVPGTNQNFLLASCLRDLVYITSDFALKPLFPIYGCYSICPSKTKSGRVFLGSASGIQAIDLQFSGDKIRVVNSFPFPDIKESVRKIVTTPEGDLWIRTAYNEIFKIEFSGDQTLDNYKIIKFETLNKQFPELVIYNLYAFSDKITLTTNAGILSTFIEKNSHLEHVFQSDKSFGVDFSRDSLVIQSIVIDQLGNAWLANSNGISFFNFSTKGLNSTSSLNRLNGYQIQDIEYIDQLGITIKTESELYFVNENNSRNTDIQLNSFISEISIGTNFKKEFFNSFNPLIADTTLDVPFDQNSIKVHLTTPFYQKARDLKWSYFLEGYDGNWKTTENSILEFQNLPSGKFTLYVKAKNIYGDESPIEKIAITIQTPWYKKTIFIIIFSIAGIIVIWMITISYSWRLTQEKKKLQQIIKEAVQKEEEQYEEIESQAERLVIVNKELEKLSIVASKTDNAITILNAQGKIEWINEGYIRMYGFTLEEVQQKSNFLMGENATATINDMVDVWYGRRVPIVFENVKRTKSGQKIWAQTTLTPIINQNKELTQLIAIDTDITKLKLAESEIAAQKIEIEAQRDLALNQRDEILQQKKEIVDSITYANRIQKAVSLDEKTFQSIFQKSFVFFQARDIVSGDFYWAYSKENLKIIATVDCTGHGVPGAFLSLIGISFLNEIIKDKSIFQPFEVLNLLRERVIYSLGQTGQDGEAKDGMDISICLINERTKTLTFAGANSPAYLISGNDNIELEADKMPISIYIHDTRSFNQYEFNYQQGDMLYLFTDGFADQFGGNLGKKYMTRNLKKFLHSISDKELPIQKILLQQEHQTWRGVLSQVDDILIVGIKLE